MFTRLALDANALLNATFVDGSWSQLVVREASRRKDASIVLGPDTRAEAVTVARTLATKLGRQVDPAQLLDVATRFWGFIEVPGGVVDVPEDIPRHDRHVYVEALSANAVILTSDASLRQAAGANAAFPLEVLRSWQLENPELWIAGVTPTHKSGSFFFRGHPNWACSPHPPGRAYVADTDSGFSLYYDGGRKEWVGRVLGAKPLAIPAKVVGTETVALSWRAGEAVRLRVGSVDHPRETCLNSAAATPLGEISVGTTRDGAHSWNGHVKAFVIDDRPIGKDVWQKLRASEMLTPNPYDSDRLSLGILRKLAY